MSTGIDRPIPLYSKYLLRSRFPFTGHIIQKFPVIFSVSYSFDR